ncbi:MAG: MFS transporter [Chthoniobacter sp.]|uniref:MFS transporter n=1 Tax=Chthoniobacter sp. TaxID=2510640 RepID=UPI0032ADB423
MPLDPLAPTALSEQELEMSMRKNVAAGALGTVWLVAVYGLPLPLFMQAIHATGFQLGLMGAVRQAAMFTQLPSAFFVERLHRRKPFWATIASTHRALWLVPAFLPLLWPTGEAHWVVVIIVALGLSDCLGNASTAPWLSWMADLLPAGRAGRFWGGRQRLLSIVVLIAALSFGWILDKAGQTQGSLLGFTVVFSIAAIFGLGDIVVHSGVIEPAPLRSAPGQSPWKRLLVPLRSRDFRRVTLAMGAWMAALALPGYFNGTPGFFNVVYLHEAFDATYSEASWLILASALGAVMWSHPIGHRIDRFGARAVAMFLVAVGPLFTLMWFFASPTRVSLPFIGPVPQPVLLMSAASLIIGGFYAGMQLCQLRLTQALTPNTGRTVAMAVHWSTAGVIGSIGALTGGWIKDHMPLAWSTWNVPGGAAFSYFHVLILLQVLLAWGVALPLLASVHEGRRAEIV